MTDEEKRYEDDDFVERYKLPSPYPDLWYFIIRHKASGNAFRVEAKDRDELAFKVGIGDWVPDPRNEPPPDDEDE